MKYQISDSVVILCCGIPVAMVLLAIGLRTIALAADQAGNQVVARIAPSTRKLDWAINIGIGATLSAVLLMAVAATGEAALVAGVGAGLLAGVVSLIVMSPPTEFNDMRKAWSALPSRAALVSVHVAIGVGIALLYAAAAQPVY